MQEAGLPLLTNWQNFYVIIGSGAATLTGLMFVVVALLFVGIHNAWDLVTFLAIDRSHPENKSRD